MLERGVQQGVFASVAGWSDCTQGVLMFDNKIGPMHPELSGAQDPAIQEEPAENILQEEELLDEFGWDEQQLEAVLDEL